MIEAFVLNIGIAVAAVVSLFLVHGVGKDGARSYVKETIVVIGVALLLLAMLNISYALTNSGVSVQLEIYARVAIAILWFLFAFKAIYAEVRHESRRRQKELEALNDVALSVGQSMDLDRILNNALSSVMRIGDFDVGFIYLLNREKDLLELAVAHGNIPDSLAKKLSTLRLGQEV